MKAIVKTTTSITLIIVVLLGLVTPITSAAPFTDVPRSASYYTAVEWAWNNGLILGSGGRFNPKGAMTRGDFCLILWRMENKPNPTGAGGMFSDMRNPTHSQYKAITWANENGILLGSGGKCFPKNTITRDQMATMLYRYNVAKGRLTTTDALALNAFSDGRSKSGATAEHMRWAVTYGLIKGSGGRLNWSGKATREAAVTVLYRYHCVFRNESNPPTPPPPIPPSPFTDILVSAGCLDAVKWADTNGIITASNGRFFPSNAVTRAVFVLALWRLENEPPPTQSAGFSDVARSDVAHDAISWAFNNKLVAGSNGKFNPNGSITRQDMTLILHRYNDLKGRNNSSNTAALNAFSDRGSISAGAVAAMRWAVTHGIIKGSGGKLSPKGIVTREAAALVLFRYVNTLVGKVSIPEYTPPARTFKHLGSRPGCVAVVEEGLRHIGYHPRPNIFTRYAGLTSEWCAMFVNYVYENTTDCMIHTPAQHRAKQIRSWSTTTIMNTARTQGRWADGNYMNPAPGDWILFNWGGRPWSAAEHIGIVVGHDGEWVYYVDGNTGGNQVKCQSRPLTNGSIRGYVIMFP